MDTKFWWCFQKTSQSVKHDFSRVSLERARPQKRARRTRSNRLVDGCKIWKWTSEVDIDCQSNERRTIWSIGIMENWVALFAPCCPISTSFHDHHDFFLYWCIDGNEHGCTWILKFMYIVVAVFIRNVFMISHFGLLFSCFSRVFRWSWISRVCCVSVDFLNKSSETNFFFSPQPPTSLGSCRGCSAITPFLGRFVLRDLFSFFIFNKTTCSALKRDVDDCVCREESRRCEEVRLNFELCCENEARDDYFYDFEWQTWW